MSDFEAAKLKELQCKKLYLRLFDVDWNTEYQQVRPVAIINIHRPLDTFLEYIPTVFITQQTLTHLKTTDIKTTAANIVTLLSDVCNQSGCHPSEIQIDCDWTSKTKSEYFELLQAIKQQPYLHGKILSATIRLYQVKYMSSCGVPPVDRGLVMCYNMGNLKNVNTKNSILDVAIAKQYLTHLDRYPLALDIGLPLFKWSLLYHNNNFRGILRDIGPENLSDTIVFKKTTVSLRLFERYRMARLYNCGGGYNTTREFGYGAGTGDSDFCFRSYS